VNGLTAFPNPFNDNLNFSFNLATKAMVKYTITDQIGNLVYSNDHGVLESGNHTLEISAKTLDGKSLSTGMYYLTINAGGSQQTISILKK
jgi:flagellar hook assembly protein FlgD